LKVLFLGLPYHGAYEPSRRYATLVAIPLDTSASLTDEILDLHDRLIGSFFAKAKHKHERSFAEAVREGQ
jgi:hypothetical protein